VAVDRSSASVAQEAARDSSMSTTLFDAIAQHDVDALASELAAGADPNQLLDDWPHWRPLHAAIDELEEGGPIEAVVLLLARGATVDGREEPPSSTPLLMASFRKQPDAVRILLAAGADPNVIGDEGDSRCASGSRRAIWPWPRYCSTPTPRRRLIAPAVSI
jgi:ankyrin repeat protein